ncbi:hypothetical protein D0Z07_8766 [Hyphodiscus hymeniophilus]|uniref:Uncharacterized protein n=1 Tax=Hyphodiscus hymeniophilus TaxID=353542 RepID=A0A9P6VDV2_9HELO|nr:hypothetical protein D0Z07_8766 [Hyphodiscus hymeniophilus]
MPRTRTSTGTIHRLQYDMTSLQLKGESPPASPRTTTGSRPASRSPLRIRKISLASRTSSSKTFSSKPQSPITKRATTRAPKRPLSPQAPDFAALGLTGLMPAMVDICEGIDFFPRRAWGEREEEGLSAIGRAEREVEIWEEVKRSHAEGAWRIWCRVKNPGRVAVQERLDVLAWALKTCKFQAERENIEGAICAYQSGEIGYTSHYTILYSGKVVDTAPNYGSFVTDRQERLDRYHAAHGPHWIWYEPPLKVDPEARPAMFGSTALHRIDSYSNLGAWHVTQGFWKRSGWVNRMSGTAKIAPSALEPRFQKLPDGKVYCQDAGPKQAFRSVLDSGATYPSLHASDFQKLMIDESNYAAQSVETLNSANGVMYSRLFELFVAVLDDKQRNLVDDNHCAHPWYAKYLGGLCPVAEVSTNISYDAEGREVPMRLSGLLPFVACYMSCTPTRNAMYLGEDRKDVLGSHRMPGHRKWDIALSSAPPVDMAEVLATYGDPKTTFSHRQGEIIDQDDLTMDFASDVTFKKGTPQEVRQRNCPKEEVAAARARREAERIAAADAELAKVTADLRNEILSRPEVVKAIKSQVEADRVREEQQLVAGGGGFAPPQQDSGDNPMPGQGGPEAVP